MKTYYIFPTFIVVSNFKRRMEEDKPNEGFYVDSAQVFHNNLERAFAGEDICGAKLKDNVTVFIPANTVSMEF